MDEYTKEAIQRSLNVQILLSKQMENVADILAQQQEAIEDLQRSVNALSELVSKAEA